MKEGHIHFWEKKKNVEENPSKSYMRTRMHARKSRLCS